MNVREVLEEGGYHVSGDDFHLVVNLHGNHQMNLKRESRSSPWLWSRRYGRTVSVDVDNALTVMLEWS